MKVFLVGATGVIGHYLTPQLLTGGDEVVALVRSRERAEAMARAGVHLFEGDLLEATPESLRAMLADCDVAVHLATALRPGSPGLGTTNTNAALRTTGTRRLLDAALKTGVPRYIQQSIAMSYVDGGDSWLDEEAPFSQGDDPRGGAGPVVEMEAMVRALDPARVAWIILRGGSFVGSDTRQAQVINELRTGTLRVPGDGSNWVSFVHVADYAAAVASSIHSAVKGAAFNITAEPVRNGDYLDRLAQLLNVPVPPREPALPLPRSYRCSNTAAKAALGWSPTTDIWALATQGV